MLVAECLLLASSDAQSASMSYFVSYMQWWEAPIPTFPTPYRTPSMWVPMNVVVDQHPLKWLDTQDRNSVKITWWTEILTES